MDDRDEFLKSSSDKNVQPNLPVVRTEPVSAPSASNVRTTRSGFLFRTGSDPLVRTNQPIGSPSSLMSMP